VSENKPNNNFAQNLYNDLNATIEKRACKGKEKPYVMLTWKKSPFAKRK